MEGVLRILQWLALVGVGVFALMQCFALANRDPLGRPAVGWLVRACLIVLAAVCFFTVAHLAATR